MSNSKLIVNYLPQNLTLKEFQRIFVAIGPVESCHVMRDYKTGYSYGFGFVNYTNSEDADKAIRQLNGLELYNKRIKVSFARPPGENIKDTNLYITNLPRHYSEEDLENLFNIYGTIVQRRILFDKYSGKSRGVAFVRFDKREEAQNAIQHLDGQTVEGSSEQLSVRLAEEHGKKRAAFFAGYKAAVGQLGLPYQNEMEKQFSRVGNPGISERRGFGSSINMYKHYQGVSGFANNLRNNYRRDCNQLLPVPFQGVSDIADQNEMEKQFSRVGNPGISERRGFGSSINMYKHYQGVSGFANNLRNNYRRDCNQLLPVPFQGVSDIADLRSIGYRQLPTKFIKKQNRFNPLAFRMP